MIGINAVNLGEQLITIVNNSSKTKIGKNQIKQLQLNKEELMKLTEKNDKKVFDLHRNDNNYIFGRYLYDWYNWVLDVSCKAKTNYEVLVMSLKQDGKEVFKGAYSKTRVDGGNIQKFHIVEGDTALQTGYTNKKGKVLKSTQTDLFPENYKDYLWRLDDKSLLIISDYFGLFGKLKPMEEICKEWGIKKARVFQIKNRAMRIIGYAAEGGFPAIKETDPHKCTIEDYIHAIRHLQNNNIYKFMQGYRSSGVESTIIDDKFLKEVAEIRKSREIISEWEMTRKRNSCK